MFLVKAEESERGENRKSKKDFADKQTMCKVWLQAQKNELQTHLYYTLHSNGVLERHYCKTIKTNIFDKGRSASGFRAESV